MKIAAGRFKAQCLSLMDQVHDTRREVIITKRGKAVAKLVPADDAPREVLGLHGGHRDASRGRPGPRAELATAFPLEFPRDPADRLIAATARAEGLTLVTADGRIAASPLVKTVW